jgi:hypothetical protein
MNEEMNKGIIILKLIVLFFMIPLMLTGEMLFMFISIIIGLFIVKTLTEDLIAKKFGKLSHITTLRED